MKSKSITVTNKEQLNHIALFIRNYRYISGMTQKELAAKTGYEVHFNTIRNIEVGRNYSMQTLIRICEALNIDLSEIFENK